MVFQTTKKDTLRNCAILFVAFVMGLLLLMTLAGMIPGISVGQFSIFAGNGPQSAATGQASAAGSTMVTAIIQIVCTIVQVIGVILGIVGLAKFAISHSEGQGADQQKAIMMLGTGVVLVVLPAILNKFAPTFAELIAGTA